MKPFLVIQRQMIYHINDECFKFEFRVLSELSSFVELRKLDWLVCDFFINNQKSQDLEVRAIIKHAPDKLYYQDFPFLFTEQAFRVGFQFEDEVDEVFGDLADDSDPPLVCNPVFVEVTFGVDLEPNLTI